MCEVICGGGTGDNPCGAKSCVYSMDISMCGKSKLVSLITMLLVICSNGINREQAGLQ